MLESLTTTERLILEGLEQRSSEQREGFGRGVAVIMLLPRALDGNDHPLGRVHVDVLAEGANRHEGAAVDAGWSVRQHPPLVTVSQGVGRHQPAEGVGSVPAFSSLEGEA